MHPIVARFLGAGVLAVAVGLVYHNFVNAGPDPNFVYAGPDPDHGDKGLIIKPASKTYEPEQVHLSLGTTESEFRVQWATVDQSALPEDTERPWVIYGKDALAVAHYDRGDLVEGLSKSVATSILMYLEIDEAGLSGPEAGEECRTNWNASCVARTYTTHWANMTGLDLGTTYFYKVGSPNSSYSWNVYKFKTRGTRSDKAVPLTYGIYGDMGDYNGQVRPMMTHLVEEGKLDIVFHLGDFAYNIDSDEGRNGDRYFRDMEGITASVPYMVCSGNHEMSQNWNQYTQRFQLMPSNSGPLPSYPQFGHQATNNWWFSFQTGYMYVIMVKTTVYGYAKPDEVSPRQKEWEKLRKMQYEWLEKELAIANTKRDESPWLVIGTHHPLYCTGNHYDCGTGATNLREGVRPVGSPNDTAREYGLEKLFYEAGVDLVMYGHVHNYERYFDISPMWNSTDSESSGLSTLSTRNPPAPIYLTTGAAGSVEAHEGFELPHRDAIAFRLGTYSWTNMQVFNETHIRWKQVQADNTRPPDEMGQIVDDAWFIQEKHGPRASLSEADFEQLDAREPQQAPSGDRVGRILEGLEDFAPVHSSTAGEARCRRGSGGLICEKAALEKQGAKFGLWQATARMEREREMQV